MARNDGRAMLKGTWETLLAVDRLQMVVADDVVVCTSSCTCGRTAVTITPHRARACPNHADDTQASYLRSYRSPRLS